ncbi:uncharacterized protein LOC130957984 [Arachis stenosperma]|uniref:uncharacterized protein LOC130957984 n=1 Tax=Arachis stenosperma TaxID=217475 RepID=UPI0025ACD2F7|nr:uncharacterized protein LOC130957984 [Arachis stenosperma]
MATLHITLEIYHIEKFERTKDGKTMYVVERTKEAALDAAAAEFEASLGTETQPQATITLNPSPKMPHTLQVPPHIRPPTTKNKENKEIHQEASSITSSDPCASGSNFEHSQQSFNASVKPPTVSPYTMQGASAGITSRFAQFMPTPRSSSSWIQTTQTIYYYAKHSLWIIQWEQQLNTKLKKN